MANHGEVFIRKNTGIGRNLQKARVYQKSHEHFENVAQVSEFESLYTNDSRYDILNVFETVVGFVNRIKDSFYMNFEH